MASSLPCTRGLTRKAYRCFNHNHGGASELKLVTETVPQPLPPNAILVKIHAISINYRDANIIHGGNPWRVLPHGIPCSDAAGEITSVGTDVSMLKIGDRVTPILDQASITGREQTRTWLAADVDGVLAEWLVIDENLVCKFPDHLDWDEASTLPCAGLTAWSALKGMGLGDIVLIQGTGGVSMMALKLARAAGCKVILSSSSDEKLKHISDTYDSPPLLTVNYAKQAAWHERVVELSGGYGVDLVLENGGTGSLVQSMKCTKRAGTVSQVGYLGKQHPADLSEMLPILIDKKINLRGINVGSKHDLEDLYAAVGATQMHFDDIIHTRYSFETAAEAIEYVWQGKQIGKVVIEVDHY